MTLMEKVSAYKADVYDIGCTKIAVFAATLLVAKLWDPILSLEWYWYVVVFAAAVIKPLITFFKWLK